MVKDKKEICFKGLVSKIEQDGGLSLPRISYCQITIQEAGDCSDISNIKIYFVNVDTNCQAFVKIDSFGTNVCFYL